MEYENLANCPPRFTQPLQNGHESCVAVLIQAGADVREDGDTPMKIAISKKREKVVTLLRYYERV